MPVFDVAHQLYSMAKVLRWLLRLSPLEEEDEPSVQQVFLSYVMFLCKAGMVVNLVMTAVFLFTGVGQRYEIIVMAIASILFISALAITHAISHNISHAINNQSNQVFMSALAVSHAISHAISHAFNNQSNQADCRMKEKQDQQRKIHSTVLFATINVQTLQVVLGLFHGNSRLGYCKLIIDLVMFSAFAALPYWAMENNISENGKVKTFGWTLFAIEIADLVTLCLGFVQFSAPGMAANWVHHMQAFSYWLMCTLVLCLFGGLAAELVANICVGEKRPERVYKRTIQLVLFLDVCTDLPAIIITMISRAYIHNIALTLNICSNWLALLRAVYLGLFFSASAREAKRDAFLDPLLS